MTLPGVAEPLAASASLALRLASTLCRKDPATGESCDWYHGPWQFFRLMGLVITPAQHGDFYQSALEAVARQAGAPRVLISAAADYSMLAHVLATLRTQHVEPEITMVDVCETPLALSSWYAERVGYPIRTCRRDILEYRDDRPFDVICTHSFLGRFTPAERPRLLVKWRELLRSGGALITVNRIQPAAAMDRTAFTRDQADAFRAAALRGAESLRPSIPNDPLEVARHVDSYTSRQGAYPVRTREEFLGLFEQAGFEVQRLSWGPISAGDRHEVRGPGVPGGAEYGRIVAIRS